MYTDLKWNDSVFILHILKYLHCKKSIKLIPTFVYLNFDTLCLLVLVTQKPITNKQKTYKHCFKIPEWQNWNRRLN